MMPIIDKQKRMVEIGRIRAGAKDERGNPKKGTHWRLTSRDKDRLEVAAGLWGGTVEPWEGHLGEFELQTETADLPIMLLPDTEPSLYYELWSKGGCQRRCDGVTEVLTDRPCICGEERECKPHLRFPVLLPSVPGIGTWLVQSTGENAAREIPGVIALLTRVSIQGELLPLRLRLEQRVKVSEGQTKRFVVPVIDAAVSFNELMGAKPPEQAALPSGFVPVAAATGSGTSIQQGILEAETQEVRRTPRSAAAFGNPDDDLDFGAAPTPPLENAPEAVEPPSPPPPPSDTGNTVAASTRDKPATAAQKKKLNVLVGTLREKMGVLTTEALYATVAVDRKVLHDGRPDVETIVGLTPDYEGTPAQEEDGTFHWAPLRETLTRGEANSWIDRLEGLEARSEKVEA